MLELKGKRLFESWIDHPNLTVRYSSFKGKKMDGRRDDPGASIVIETGPALAEYRGSLVVAWDPDASPSAVDYSFGS